MAKKQLRIEFQIKDQDLADYRNTIKHHRNAFTGQSVSGWDAESFDHLPAGIVFLVGFPRSGTTLTEQILGPHPDFVTIGELPVLSRLSTDIGLEYGLRWIFTM